MEPNLNLEDVLQIIKGLMKFPFAQICRHSVALDLVSALEQKGWKPPEELCRAICRAEDDVALNLIEKLCPVSVLDAFNSSKVAE